LIFTNPDKDGFFDALQFDRRFQGWLLGDPVKGGFALFLSEDEGRNWVRQHNKGLRADPAAQGAFAASNSSLIPSIGYVSFASGGRGGAFTYSTTSVNTCLDCTYEQTDYEGRDTKWACKPVPVGEKTEASGVFSIAGRNAIGKGLVNWPVVAVGGDYTKPDEPAGTAAFFDDVDETWRAAQTMPHGYRSSVAYDSATKTWITVGPNGTDVSTDDGRNWHALHPDAARHEAADADKNWNALSLPFVVGPHGRIGKLDPQALPK
jgi:photosystem II stability/assembly factor-like uncharacterized protein